ncbi:MAG TPA: GNAT family N-acetyltransferase [Ferruginibacter sp.]|jgi:N-acetylglutamate synthase-like GNAT family acetyltransferase|nr:GNAT family N-acetyltransferase [Ferruginibacter sp.]
MTIYEVTKNEFLISTDKQKLDVQLIVNYLSNESYWAKNIPVHIVEKSIAGSLCFAVYEKKNEKEQQVGFARVITDHATFAYLADVFILEQFRGKGLSKWLIQEIMHHPELQGLRRWMLATKDAHGLYAQFGFLPLDKPERIMGLKPFEEYPKTKSV